MQEKYLLINFFSIYVRSEIFFYSAMHYTNLNGAYFNYKIIDVNCLRDIDLKNKLPINIIFLFYNMMKNV